MTTPSEPGRPDLSDSAIMSERRRLINLGYRLLGSVAEAEDAVQETYARWYSMSREEQSAIGSPAGWLTTVASRICLDQLRSARARREKYVGEWLPEPVPSSVGWTDSGLDDPADRVTLDESITMAFLVMLEAMTPAQRVTFILHDVFRYSFVEVAAIVGRTPAACRQLATSARRRIQSSSASPSASSSASSSGQHTEDVVKGFKQAWEAKDIGALIGLLDPTATATGDGGGLANAALEPVEGGERIARYFTELAVRATEGITVIERTVNGQPGLVTLENGVITTVLAFSVVDDRITQIWAIRNPEKLRSWTS